MKQLDANEHRHKPALSLSLNKFAVITLGNDAHEVAGRLLQHGAPQRSFGLHTRQQYITISQLENLGEIFLDGRTKSHTKHALNHRSVRITKHLRAVIGEAVRAPVRELVRAEQAQLIDKL